jgi:hypothetical protein
LYLEPSGSLEVTLASPTNYGTFNIIGNAALRGALMMTPSNGYIPAPVNSFPIVSYSSFSGGFTSFNLPNLLAGTVWRPIYSSNVLNLAVEPPIALLPSGTNMVVCLNGTPGHEAILLTSTNVAMPLFNWTPVVTNVFDATTYLGVTNTINPNTPRQFFIFKLQ